MAIPVRIWGIRVCSNFYRWSESVIGRVFENGRVEHYFRHTKKIGGVGLSKVAFIYPVMVAPHTQGGKLIHTFIGELRFIIDFKRCRKHNK